MKKRMAWLMCILVVCNLVSTPVLAQTETKQDTKETAETTAPELAGVKVESPLTATQTSEDAIVKTVESIVGYDADSFAAYRTLTVKKGTQLLELNLPETVEAVVNGETIAVPVAWTCIDDSFGGKEYVPEHENDGAVFTFISSFKNGYTSGGALKDAITNGRTMPWIEVRYETAENTNANAKTGGLTDLGLKSSDANARMAYDTDLYSNSFNIESSNGIGTTFANSGYAMYLSVDGSKNVWADDNRNMILENGKVDVYKDIQYQPNLSFTEDGAFVKVSYNFYNEGTTSHSLDIFGGTDIQIGEDDEAPISRTKTGFTMLDENEGGQNQFSFYCKSTYGVTPADTYWFGSCFDLEDNFFNNVEEDSFEGDSGMAFSWQDRTIEPGETQTFTVLFGIGEPGDPPQLDVDQDLTLEYQQGKVAVEAKVIEKTDRTYNVFYSLDGGSRTTLNVEGSGTRPISGTGKLATVTGTIDASGWAKNSVHTIELWVQNDKNAMSEVKSVKATRLPNGDTGQIQTCTVSFDKNGASGLAPESQTGENFSTITIPGQGTMNFSNATFGGWTDGTNTYQPGDEYEIPLGSEIELKAVWEISYSVEYYLEGEIVGAYEKDDTYTVWKTGNPGEQINADEKQIDHYVLDKEAEDTIASAELPNSEGDAVVLKLYYKRAEMNVTFDANGGAFKNAGEATRKVRWGTKLGTLPELAERAGFTVDKWTSSNDGKTVNVTADTVISSDCTVQAQWLANTPSVDTNNNSKAALETSSVPQTGDTTPVGTTAAVAVLAAALLLVLKKARK